MTKEKVRIEPINHPFGELYIIIIVIYMFYDFYQNDYKPHFLDSVLTVLFLIICLINIIRFMENKELILTSDSENHLSSISFIVIFVTMYRYMLHNTTNLTNTAYYTLFSLFGFVGGVMYYLSYVNKLKQLNEYQTEKEYEFVWYNPAIDLSIIGFETFIMYYVYKNKITVLMPVLSDLIYHILELIFKTDLMSFIGISIKKN